MLAFVLAVKQFYPYFVRTEVHGTHGPQLTAVAPQLLRTRRSSGALVRADGGVPVPMLMLYSGSRANSAEWGRRAKLPR
ncbi:hypothetical protein T07_2674 [Trichinella nelsoni]|uniref:Uncharacterized protein n=1 Tax=Trichinella nelsoni TaxID=6336 RepID=A0A0V0RG70_9BILA|nr:hypothetical protein T07_2674 [Trichinella nelsoni]